VHNCRGGETHDRPHHSTARDYSQRSATLHGSRTAFAKAVNFGMVLCPTWSREYWLELGRVAHNAIVTITYFNGTVLEAIVLSHDDGQIRVLAAGCDDVLAFTRIRGAWISEDIEPVTIEFKWQRRVARPVPSVEDCVCSKDLAARLIQTLCAGCEPEDARQPALASNPERHYAAIPLC
jgi:hypothetical protein